MTKKEFHKLLKKVDSGKASAEEEKRLLDWYAGFEKDPLPEDGVLSESEQEELLAHLRLKVNQPVIDNRSFTVIYKIAATLLLCALTALMWHTYRQQRGTIIYAIIQKGERRKLVLPDSSIVWLNADSKLSYPSVFEKNSREVTLSGEGYFEVKHDAARPFTVHANNINVEVLGTVFDIKAYPQDQQVETSLIRGSVRVSVTGGSKKGQQAILHPNQKFVLLNNTGMYSGNDDSLQDLVKETAAALLVKETGWRNNSLSFENKQLDELVPQLERWFAIRIVVKNPELKHLKFTGTLDNASLDTVMQALMLSGHFNYRKEADDTIVIY
jgi:ferric-dicitrate binding protein FerR (iron transport regulator)